MQMEISFKNQSYKVIYYFALKIEIAVKDFSWPGKLTGELMVPQHTIQWSWLQENVAPELPKCPTIAYIMQLFEVKVHDCKLTNNMVIIMH